MSCRTTHAGSLATTFISRLYDLEDGMATSLFHELKRRFDEGGIMATDSHTFLSTVAEFEQTIQRNDLWSEALRRRALARVTNVFVGGMPEPAVAAAFVNIQERARLARIGMNIFITEVGDRLGIPAGIMKDEFKRLYRSYNRAANTSQTNETIWDYSIHSGPQDAATRYAAGVMQHGSRCATCGQFTGAEGQNHTCPAVGDRPMTFDMSNLDNVERQEEEYYWDDDDDYDDGWDDNHDDYNEDHMERNFRDLHNQIANNLSSENTDLPIFEVLPVEAWDMDEFQEMYDKAKAAIAADEIGIPFIENPLPGQVTGGLGVRGVGNSFGIELEIDFPEDDYPYSAREIFARRLHEEGIVSAPFVQRWHYVGEDRPGGDYTVDPNNWVCEFDRSVDDVDGERGVEIKSQILYDEPQTWHNVKRICEIARELGGRPTHRTGLHVNVGGSKFDNDNVEKHNALLRLASSYDDVILRLAHNPLSGQTHRGRGYCSHAPVPPTGFRNISQARAYSNHYQAFNLGHLPAEGERMRDSSRVEVRIWDSTLDPGRIQGAVVASLGIVKMAEDKINPGQPSEVAGSHRNTYGRTRLEGDAWTASTESFRRFVSLIGKVSGNAEHHKEVLTHMFASSRWQG